MPESDLCRINMVLVGEGGKPFLGLCNGQSGPPESEYSRWPEPGDFVDLNTWEFFTKEEVE